MTSLQECGKTQNQNRDMVAAVKKLQKSGLIIAGIFLYFVPLQAEQAAILLLFSALPPAVLNFLVAEKFNQEPQQVASIVLLGNLGSIVFIPLVLWFIL